MPLSASVIPAKAGIHVFCFYCFCHPERSRSIRAFRRGELQFPPSHDIRVTAKSKLPLYDSLSLIPVVLNKVKYYR